MTDEPHLSVEDLASLIDGSLVAAERATAEHHLASCDECREELAASARAVASASTAPARRFPWRLIVPLAAGIVLAVLLRAPSADDGVDQARERAAVASRDAHIVTVFPPARAALRAETVRFVWRPIEASIGYRVVVKEASGAPVWSGEVTDTVLAIPDSVRLRAGTPYVWRVDGERTDGTTASSAEVEFRIER
jgi:anti-sigma factor RsiW